MLKLRIQNLVSAMPEGFEAALIKTQENRFYLLDLDSHDAGTLVVFPDRAVFIIDSRYIEVARDGVKSAEVVLERNPMEQVGELLKQQGATRLYVENQISVALCESIKEKLQGVEIVSDSTLSDALSNLRAIKSPQEIDRMKQAQIITDACFSHILPLVREGVRELDLALEMEHFMRSNGADGIAFDTICVAGKKSSLPHGIPGDNRVAAGDFITFDFGAKYKGYCTDMTRTVAFGKPSEEQVKVYNTVLEAHLAGIQAAKAGSKGNEVDKASRDIIEKAGYAEYFGHGLGHAVGINVHESPRFSPLCKDEILPGMMMTVEPGIYLPGKFGCRIEDTVLITETGCEPLPSSDKQLIIL